VRQLLRANQLQDLNAHLLLRISDCFIKRFVNNQAHESDPDREAVEANPTTMPEFLRHKAQLYRFFDQVTAKMSDDKIWRLICRIKSSLKEPIEEVKALKMKELNCLMKINWQVDLELCETVERALGELVNDIFSKCTPSDEEQQFVGNTAKVIESSLHRPCKV